MDNIKDDTTIIEVKNLIKIYGLINKKKALENVSFNIERGSFHGFIGKNGAGKTTTMKIIVGAFSNYKGYVKIDGISNEKEESKMKIGYVPEKAVFPKGFNVLKYLKTLAVLSGLSKVDAHKVVMKKLKEFGLLEFIDKFPNKLSSGEKKKVLLAQALMHQPEILIMDEPAANLDPQSRMELFSTLKKYSKQGLTVFISSHVLTELEKYIDSFTLIDQGKIIYSGSANALNQSDEERWEIEVDNLELAINELKNKKIKFIIKNKNIIFVGSKKEVIFVKELLDKKVFVQKTIKYQKNLEKLFLDLIETNEEKGGQDE